MTLTLPSNAVRKVSNTILYEVSLDDELIFVTPLANTEVKLYAANTHDCTGKIISIRNSGTEKMFLSAALGQIEGNTYYYVEPTQMVTVKSDGVDWWIASNDDFSHQIEHLNQSGTVNIDWDIGKNQVVVLTGSANFVFTGGKPGGHYNLVVWQDGAGGHSYTWGGGNIAWSGNIAPQQTTVGGTVDLYAFYFDGDTYIGAGSLYTTYA